MVGNVDTLPPLIWPDKKDAKKDIPRTEVTTVSAVGEQAEIVTEIETPENQMPIEQQIADIDKQIILVQSKISGLEQLNQAHMSLESYKLIKDALASLDLQIPWLNKKRAELLAPNNLR